MQELYPNQNRILAVMTVVIAVLFAFLISSHKPENPSNSSVSFVKETASSSANETPQPSSAPKATTQQTEPEILASLSAVPTPADAIDKTPDNESVTVNESGITGKGTPRMVKLAQTILDKKIGPAEAGMLINSKGYVPVTLSVNGNVQQSVAANPKNVGMVLEGKDGNIIVTSIKLG